MRTPGRSFALPFVLCLVILGIVRAQPGAQPATDKQNAGRPGGVSIPIDQLRDKIAGGWAGKMIGVSFGDPTEFRSNGRINDAKLDWAPSGVSNALEQDDLYVQMSFMMTMDKHGMNAPTELFAESFARAGYRLWHANVQARKNFLDGIMPPASGSAANNMHADDIDFQIEADFIGLMSPGMPRTSNAFCDRVGHIMNYGDGVYGGMFVSALYTQAFVETDIPTVVAQALRAIPAESDYARIIREVIALHATYPNDWRATWNAIEKKWGAVDICRPMEPFNIDAKLNGAYVVIGLLYGGGDFTRTLETTVRSGQDSDCNPSTAAGVLGVIKGYKAIPDEWKSGIPAIADSKFVFTDYSFNSVVERTLHYAKQLIRDNGGTVDETTVSIKRQEPTAPPLEVSFPGMKAAYRSSAIDGLEWNWKGEWQTQKSEPRISFADPPPLNRYTGSKGAEASLTFKGTGVAVDGRWARDGGRVEVYLDGRLHKTIDTFWGFPAEQTKFAVLWHVLNLKPGTHTVRFVVTGNKNPSSTGTQIFLAGATVFTAKTVD